MVDPGDLLQCPSLTPEILILAFAFLHRAQEPNNLGHLLDCELGHLLDCGALIPLRVASNFYLPTEHVAILVAINDGFLREQLMTIYEHFGTHNMSSSWWNQIVLCTWDDTLWLRNFCMCWAIFMDVISQLVPQIE